MKEEERERIARTVECRRCNAEMGEGCKSTSTGKGLPRAHQLRVADAGGSWVLPPGTQAPELGNAFRGVSRAAGEGAVDAVRDVVTGDAMKDAARGLVRDLVGGFIGALGSLYAQPAVTSSVPSSPAPVEDEAAGDVVCGECGAFLRGKVKGVYFDGFHKEGCSKIPKKTEVPNA